MATLVIRTKKPTFRAPARPSMFDRFARRFYEARMHMTIRKLDRRALFPRFGSL